MTSILHRIILDNGSKASLERIRSVLGNRIYGVVYDKTINRVNALGELALRAYRSKVPVDTTRLRNTNIQGIKMRGEYQVVVSGSHTGRRGKTMQSSILAEYLDKGTSPAGRVLRRTQDSIADDPYTSLGRRTPTAGWITSARKAFAAARRRK